MYRGQPMTEGIYYILLSLLTPNHGYGIIQSTLEMTKGRVELGAGTMYGALNNLLEKGWIMLYSEEKSSRKKKQYVITGQGQTALEDELKRLRELCENGRMQMERAKAAGKELPKQDIEFQEGRCTI